MADSRLKEYIDINPKVKLQKGEMYSSVEMEKITVGQKVADANSKAEFTGKSCSKFLSNDTLMARITPCLENGKIAKYESDTAGFGSTEFFVLRAKKNKATADYVYYLSQTHYIRQLAVNSMTGASGRQRADAKYIGNIKWNFPNIEIQRKIADILSAYDNLIENNSKRIKLLEQMVENLYKEWFVRFRFPGYEDMEFENGIPKGWEVKKMKNCVKRLPFNQLYKRNELESEGKVIVIDQSSAEFLGYHNDEPSHCASIDKPILLFGDHSCKFVLMIRDFSLGENVVPFISENENKLNDYYLFYAVHKIIVTEEYKRHWGRFTAMKILVPNYELQLAFADFIRPIIQEQNNLWDETQLLIKQRDVLLPRLMSGKLEV
ncbi:hypothetical protein C6A27_05960 [Streptococcus anginosus]|uniref:Type I restriction modification DNA specificity domain-containing protein n=1 Tax=Streptococcus anginosus TaxID=1328 RepID=A0A2T0G1A8_STRAP|nr:restriction endonuclease subunit S [Streptococcus anginosus]PRT69845.1 hypothetical protein C6A27_05960 [Streptococcus anginosus]